MPIYGLYTIVTVFPFRQVGLTGCLWVRAGIIKAWVGTHFYSRFRGGSKMNLQELRNLLDDITQARIAVIGDFCLDVYWSIDMQRSEISLETGLPTHPIADMRCELGGAGNVVNNLLCLGCKAVHAVGVVGCDPWGKELLRLLESIGAEASGVFMQSKDWTTLAYVKPHLENVEQNRLDFGNYNSLSNTTARRLFSHLEKLLGKVDVVVINQQVLTGIHTDVVRAGLVELINRYPDTIFIADSRHHSLCYSGAVIKVNYQEAIALCEHSDGADVVGTVGMLFKRTGKPVFVSRGRFGCVVQDSDDLTEIPGIDVVGEIDPVGAGDSLLAGIAAALAVGRSPVIAALLGSYTAAVTIRKLRQTGTASPAEVLKAAQSQSGITS